MITEMKVCGKKTDCKEKVLIQSQREDSAKIWDQDSGNNTIQRESWSRAWGGRKGVIIISWEICPVRPPGTLGTAPNTWCQVRVSDLY